MYTKNYREDENAERFGVPPDYSGNAIPARRERTDCPPHDDLPPPISPPAPPPPSKGGILDRFSSEDILIFGAVALLVFGNGDDILSLGLLLALILL